MYFNYIVSGNPDWVSSSCLTKGSQQRVPFKALTHSASVDCDSTVDQALGALQGTRQNLFLVAAVTNTRDIFGDFNDTPVISCSSGGQPSHTGLPGLTPRYQRGCWVLLEAPGENLFPGLFQLLEAPAFFG